LALRIGVPLISDVTEGDCSFDTGHVDGEIYSVAAFGLQGLAWITATLGVASVAGLVRTD
jgi:hypothetical protein